MSKTTKINFIIAITMLGVVGGGVAFVFFNLLNNSQILEQQIIALSGQAQQEASLIQLQKSAQNSEADRTELASYFLLRESDSISFLSEIESIAPILNLSLETTGLQRLQADNRDWIETAFTVEGERGSIQEFVRILENIPYASRVMSVSMSGDERGLWQADIVIQVQLLSYDQ